MVFFLLTIINFFCIKLIIFDVCIYLIYIYISDNYIFLMHLFALEEAMGYTKAHTEAEI